MRLKYLELYGFKSFADKTRLNFDDNFACVVGPNGSGKSNIADAIRWVLGEQSAKELRGSKMQDVIFSGTQWRKAMNMAQVDLSFDNSDGTLPLSYDEVTISRKVYRSGESEYLINRMPVRRKDILELFLDTGIGREGYSLIGQGRIDELLSGRKQDRRAIFDEASGIGKYKYKKEESLKRLERTERDLEEVKVELRGKEREENVLKKQAENARLGLKLSKDLEIHELSLLKNKLDQAQREILKYQAEKDKLAEEKKELDIKKKALESKLRPYQETLESYKKDQSYLQEKIQSLKEQLQNNLSESRLREEQLHFFKRDQERTKDLLKKKKENLEEFSKQKEEFKSNIENLKEQKVQYEENLSSLLKGENKEENLSKLLNEASQKKEEIKEKLSFLEFEEKRKSEEKKKLVLSRQKKKEELDQLLAKEQEFQEKQEEIQKNIQRQKDQLNQARMLIKELEDKNNAIDKNLHFMDRESLEREKKLAEISSRRRMVQGLIDHFEGYSRAVQELLKLASKNPSISSHMLGTLASQIEVLSPYETAIDAALGGALQNIIVPSQRDGQFLIDCLKRNNIGRVTFLPIDKIRGRESFYDPDPRILSNAVDAISFDERLRPIIEHFLSRTVIVENLDDAINLSKSKRGIRILTLDGEIINSWGSMVGGKIFHKNDASLINRKSQIKKLDKALDKLNKDSENALARRKEMEEEKNKTLLSHQEQKQLIEQARDQIEELKESEILNQSELKILKSNIEETQDFLNVESSYSKEDFEEKKSELLKQKESLDENYERLKKEWESAQSQRLEEEKKSALLKEKLDYLSRDLALAENSYHDISERKQATKTEINDLDEELKKLKDQIEDNNLFIKNSVVKQKDWKETLNEVIEKAEKTAANDKDLKFKLSESLKSQEEIQKKKDKNEKDSFKNSLKLDQWEKRAEEFKEDYLSSYNILPEELDKKLKELKAVETSRSKVKEIKQALSKIGYFSYQSIEDYENLSKELEFLHHQLDDLEKSRKDILELIEDLNQTMTKLFKESFKAINEAFNKIFAKLFDGGKAQLELDSPNVLEANIEIIAQPPHKKLQNLDLLSGGERSMTALALLFAIFSIHPSPFCVLDEIDAALDEANLERYGHFLKTLTEKTQFIIITHRKIIMEMADVLYGVTMEKGVSRILFLKFDDYKKRFKEEMGDGLL